MSDALQRSKLEIDREYLLVMGLLPALATVLAMAVGFALVTGLLFVAEGLLVGSVWSQALALGVMYLLPQFVVGLGMGSRYGLSMAPPVAIAVTPILVLVLALGAFGGPALTPFQSPLLTLGAVVVWGLAAAGGLVLGANIVAPRLSARRASR